MSNGTACSSGSADATRRRATADTFKTKAEAQARVRWISGESAAMPRAGYLGAKGAGAAAYGVGGRAKVARLPDRRRTVRWCSARRRPPPHSPPIGDRPARLLTPAEVAETVQAMHGANYARGSVGEVPGRAAAGARSRRYRPQIRPAIAASNCRRGNTPRSPRPPRRRSRPRSRTSRRVIACLC